VSGKGHNEPVRARVIVLAGPSGAGKSRLAERLGLPVLRLDDFYKNGGDPTLPRITSGANSGLVDWDHPDSWLPDDALDAIERLCVAGRAEVPVYDIAQDGRFGSQVLDLAGSRFFLAEGIFAQEVVPACRDRGQLAAAYCVRQHPPVTFWRRLTRDLREHRKPPLVLVRRGLALLRDQKHVVAHAVELGCAPVSPEEAHTKVSALVSRSAADA
jgi:uridine kinase